VKGGLSQQPATRVWLCLVAPDALDCFLQVPARCEPEIHGGIAQVRDVVQLAKPVHDVLADDPAADFRGALPEQLGLDVVDEIVHGISRNRQPVAGCRHATPQFLAVILFTLAVLLDDR